MCFIGTLIKESKDDTHIVWYFVPVFAAMLSCYFLLLRNDWIYKELVNLIDSDFISYKRLPSYDVMLWKIWVWDIKKFLKGE